MKKIKSAHIIRFRNEAHYEFMVVYRNLLLLFTQVLQFVAVLYEEFTRLLQQEERLVDAMRKSEYTQKIADADRRVDNDIAAIREAIASARRHFDPAIAEAAGSLYERMKAFGNIGEKAYEEETAAVNLLLADLQGDYAAKAESIGITPWVTELRAAETAFEQLLLLRNEEQAAKPEKPLKEVRGEIDNVYHRMVDRLNAAAVLDEAGVYTEFINRLNKEIEYFNEHSHRHARKDLGAGDHTVVEPIPTQAYTGKPVVVIPKVHYREGEKPTVELIFTTDFTVTYKNNKEAGTANLVIHGTGKYRGQKTVTFNIEQNID
jgi:hypothetical protein